MNALVLAENLPVKFVSKTAKNEYVAPIEIEKLPKPEIRKETVYRRNKFSVDRVIEYDAQTGDKLRVVHYDYFNNEKIRAIDEFIPHSGKKYRTINYILYKSIDEFDTDTGKRIRTINYDIRNENRVTSIQEYDTETGKIKKVTLYRRDGQTISTIKEINPKTENVIRWTSFRESQTISSISEYNAQNGRPSKTTYFYRDGQTVREVHNYNPLNGEWKQFIRYDKHDKIIETEVAPKYQSEQEKENIAQLIDSLYNKNLRFE